MMNQRFLLNLDRVPNNLPHSSRAYIDKLPDIIEPLYPPHPSYPAVCSYDAQDPRLHEHNYQRIISTGDGSSFFRSVSYCFYGSQEYHPYVREVVVDHMHMNRQSYFPNMNDEQVRFYLYYKSKTAPSDDKRIWADEKVIQATANAFRVKMVMLFDFGDPIRYIVPHDRIYKKTIYLCFIEKHVDAMLPANVAPYETIHCLEAHRKVAISETGYFCKNDLARRPQID